MARGRSHGHRHFFSLKVPAKPSVQDGKKARRQEGKKARRQEGKKGGDLGAPPQLIPIQLLPDQG
jgi:hypothetical protein